MVKLSDHLKVVPGGGGEAESESDGADGGNPIYIPGLPLPGPNAPRAVVKALGRILWDWDADLEKSPKNCPRWIRDRGNWWVWNGTHWDRQDDEWVRSELAALLDGAVVSGSGDPWPVIQKNITEIVRTFEDMTLAPTDSGWLYDDDMNTDRWLPCANGLLNLRTRELIEHTPAYFSTWSVPFGYDPDADDPREWEAALERW